ncbi:MAG: hypothetical protein J4F48_01525 [Nitrospinae bacterium]|nr:hypothetical protein [Nitrospinota bacterium]
MPLLQSLVKEKEFATAAAFELDYDAQRDFAKALGVRWQSTIIVFKGAQEKGRSTGDVDIASIRSLMERAL